MPDHLSVIIVNYNTADLLLHCLRSLQTQQSLIREIIIVDNNSHDNTVAVVREHFPSVHLIASPENLGFGRANNLAWPLCTGELLFLLNPDTRVLPGCLSALIQYMEAHPKIGMAGTAVFDEQQRPQATVNREYPGGHYTGDLFSGLPGEIAWLLGASLVVRRHVMEQVQGFDPDYFLYGEDIDLSLRIRKAGWSLGYIPEAHIIHLEGQSERSTPYATLFEKKMQGELLFYHKQYPADLVQRIKLVRRIQALWRIAGLWLIGKCTTKKERWRKKWAKYTVAARLYR